MGIRDTSYYDWKNYIDGPHIAAEKSVVYNDISVDLSGNVFVVGSEIRTISPTGSFWFVKKSVDGGKTWNEVDRFQQGIVDGLSFPENQAVAIDINRTTDKILVVGFAGSTIVNGTMFCVRQSTDHGSTWATVYTTGTQPTGANAFATSVTSGIGSSSYSYAAGAIYHGPDTTYRWIVASSAFGDSGSWGQDIYAGANSLDAPCYAITIHPNDDSVLYAAGRENNGTLVRQGVTGSGGSVTWENVYWNPRSTGAGEEYWMTTDADVSSNGIVMVAFLSGVAGGAPNKYVMIASSSDGSSGSFTKSPTSMSYPSEVDVAARFDGDDNKYVSFSDVQSPFYVKTFRITGHVSSSIDFYGFSSGGRIKSLFVDKRNKNKIYIVGDETETGESSNFAFIRSGMLSNNSSSIGPQMLATSFGYTKVISAASGTIEEHFGLNNISEFPHSSGLFQMPNLVLGTKSQGRAGKTDDAIVQKRFIGSFVRVLFPRQDTDQDVKGYDAGRKPGKLTTDWQFGDPINIENKQFDSLALNCYASVLSSGTMDAVLVRIETKGLNDLGFTIDQTTEQTISSSFASEAILRDDVIRKNIDYGDTSLSEIGWKISVDLKNVKEIRLAAKQRNGQIEDKNKQFLIVGRFVKSQTTTNET